VRVACGLLGVGNTKMWELIGSGRVETATVDGRRLVIYASLKKLLSSSPGRSSRSGRPPKIPNPTFVAPDGPSNELKSSDRSPDGRGARS